VSVCSQGRNVPAKRGDHAPDAASRIPWKFLLSDVNPSESQLIATMVAILACHPITEPAGDSKR